MNAVAAVENCIPGSVYPADTGSDRGKCFSRKGSIVPGPYRGTVVAVFVLITLMAAALACREGETVNLSLVTDRLPGEN